MNMQNHSNVSAVAVALLAAMVGIGYYAYISAVDFPADAVRAVPFLWLLLAAAGLILAARALKKSYVSFAVIALSIPSLLLALIFAMAAVVGD
jgi:hypothetical protein